MIERLHAPSDRLGKSYHASSSDGYVLAAVLLAVLLIAALVVGVVFATTAETRTAGAMAQQRLVLTAAESAMELTIAGLDASPDDEIGIVGTQRLQVGGVDAPVVVYITRLDSSLYWLVADAGRTSPNSGIGRRIGVVVRATKGFDHSIAINRISDRAWAELF